MNGVPTIKKDLTGITNLNVNNLNANGDVTAGTFEGTTTGLYLSGATSNIQTQLNDLGLRIGLGGSSSWLWLGSFSYGTNYVVGNVVRTLFRFNLCRITNK